MPAVHGQPPTRGRLARVFGLDGNPLRRASDRAEAWIRISLLAVFLIAGPMAAVAAGGWVHQSGAVRTSPGAAQMHPVGAVLLQPAGTATKLNVPNEDYPVGVRARGVSPGGPARTSEVLASKGRPTGTVLTGSGQATASPPEPGHLADETVLAVIITLAAAAVASLVVLRLIQLFLNWRRLAAWEAAWSAIAPRWTGRRP